MKAAADPTELAATLELAAAMTRRLSTVTDTSHLHQIYNSLTSAHQSLSTFLSLPVPYRVYPPDENSDESAINAEPMQVGDDTEEEGEVRNSRSSEATMMDEVEEKMRKNFFIRNKRPKREISPSSAAEAERRRLFEDGRGIGNGIEIRFDPNATRLRNLELIHQFHC